MDLRGAKPSTIEEDIYSSKIKSAQPGPDSLIEWHMGRDSIQDIDASMRFQSIIFRQQHPRKHLKTIFGRIIGIVKLRRYTDALDKAPTTSF